jgi:hypothetical protein
MLWLRRFTIIPYIRAVADQAGFAVSVFRSIFRATEEGT